MPESSCASTSAHGGWLRACTRPSGRLHARLTDDNEWVPIASRAVEASPYTAKQVRIVLENCGEVDPLSLDDYRAREGFRALERAWRGRRSR